MSDVELERRIAAAQHEPVVVSEGARDRIMHRVRSAARVRGPRRRALPLAPRSTRHSIAGLALAASIGSVAVFSAVGPRPVAERRSAALGDSVTGTLRDTLRLMRLIRDDEHRYAFVVDGARWAPDPATTPVRADDRLVSLLRTVRDSN
jgi:hypothetical protein